MKNLKYSTMVIYRIVYSDLDEYVKMTTGHTINSQELQSSVSVWNFYQKIDGKMIDAEREEYRKFLETGQVTSLANLLQGLCASGKLDVGIYDLNIKFESLYR